jgi:hypothetical protein
MNHPPDFAEFLTRSLDIHDPIGPHFFGGTLFDAPANRIPSTIRFDGVSFNHRQRPSTIHAGQWSGRHVVGRVGYHLKTFYDRLPFWMRAMDYYRVTYVVLTHPARNWHPDLDAGILWSNQVARLAVPFLLN